MAIRFGPHMLFPDAYGRDRDWDEEPDRGSEDEPGFRPVDRPDENEPDDER